MIEHPRVVIDTNLVLSALVFGADCPDCALHGRIIALFL